MSYCEFRFCSNFLLRSICVVYESIDEIGCIFEFLRRNRFDRYATRWFSSPLCEFLRIWVSTPSVSFLRFALGGNLLLKSSMDSCSWDETAPIGVSSMHFRRESLETVLAVEEHTGCACEEDESGNWSVFFLPRTNLHRPSNMTETQRFGHWLKYYRFAISYLINLINPNIILNKY